MRFIGSLYQELRTVLEVVQCGLASTGQSPPPKILHSAIGETANNRNILALCCVLARMEKISKTELYQHGIPLLAFLPILALLSERTAAATEPSNERAQPRALSPGGDLLEPKA